MTNSLTNSVSYHRHHDDEGVDEIRIKVVPRYKTSGLSGNEWRVSALMEFYRKGHVVWSRGFSKMQYAAQALPWMWSTASESDDYKWPATNDQCFQPGCSEKAITEYELKMEFCRSCASRHPDNSHGNPPIFEHTRIKFCARHARRGDCGFEDSDVNYRVVSGDGPDAAIPKEADISPSAQMTVSVSSIEEIPTAISAAIKQARKEGKD